MRGIKTLSVLAAALGLCLVAARPAFGAGADEASGVQSRRGNASPSASASDVDDYTNQDEQINIDGGKDSIVKVLRVNQKNLVNDYVVGVFPIHQASPKEIRGLFRRITGKEGGRAEVIRDKVGGKAYLHVICPRFQLPYIEEALKALDEGWITEDVDGSHQIYYRARYRDVDAIDEIASVPGGSELDGDTTWVDEAANAIWKRGEPYRIASWLKAAEQVDLFPPQVLIDAAVYEVELSNDLKLGLDYVAWKCGPGKDLFDFIAWGFSGHQKADQVTSIFDPFLPPALLGTTERFSTRGRGHYAAASYLLTAEYLDFLLRKGRARLVTSGRLNVRHGTVGTLAVADEVLHFQRTPDEDDLIEPGGEAESGFEELLRERCLRHSSEGLTVGLTLGVIPFIGLETTELVYALELSDLVGNTPSGKPITRTTAVGDFIPSSVSSSTVLGTVLVRDGVSACVGGLKRTEEVQSTAKIPLLGSIPILGYLFGGEQNAKRHTELVVVLTPKMVHYNEVHKELARAEDALVRAQVAERDAVALPNTAFGFDQWLLGKD